jgi:hypothetical protein
MSFILAGLSHWKTTLFGALIAGLYALQNAGNLTWKQGLMAFAIAAFGFVAKDASSSTSATTTATQNGFSRLALLPALLVVSALALLMISCAATTPKPQTGQLTPWQQVTPALNAITTVNDAVLNGVIDVNQAGLLPQSTTAAVLLEQARVADVVEQLNAIVKQGSAATAAQASQVSTLIAQIENSATTMVNAGDLGVKDPKTQQEVSAIISGLGTSAETLFNVLSAAGVNVVKSPPAPSQVPVVPAPTAGNESQQLQMNVAGAIGIPGLISLILTLVLQDGPLVAASVVKLRALFSSAGYTPEQIEAQLSDLQANTTEIAEQDIGEANAWLTEHGYAPYQHTPPPA